MVHAEAPTVHPNGEKLPNASVTAKEIRLVYKKRKDRAPSPVVDLDGSWEEFTPDFLQEDDEESYGFLFPGPGLFRCSVSGLLTAPWDRAQLSQWGQKPAGPLFDFQCEERCVLQLHLPHSSTVAHVADGGVELIRPHRVTDTHVIIDITGFSGYGVVRGEGSDPESVRALVLLFYKPPAEPDVRSSLCVFMVPRNIVIRDLQRTRRKLVREEVYIETSPQCRLKPGELYSLSICSEPGADSVLVQPQEAEFDEEHHDSYFPSFHVVLKAIITIMKLSLKELSSSRCVWEREVCLLPSTVRTLSLSPKERLLEKTSGFIEGISDAVLKSLLDKLLEKGVIKDCERESVEEKQSRRDRARHVLKIVTKKGEAASSVMLEFLCELDPFFCEHLGLKPRQAEQ
ncbi:caspase recruitment domain-containing protein 8-like [Menidia menidia]